MLPVVESKRVTIRLDLDLDSDHLKGRVSTRGACSQTLSGWLGLIAALEPLIARAIGSAPHARQPGRSAESRTARREDAGE